MGIYWGLIYIYTYAYIDMYMYMYISILYIYIHIYKDNHCWESRIGIRNKKNGVVNQKNMVRMDAVDWWGYSLNVRSIQPVYG